MWSQAVFQSPSAGTSSMWTSPSGAAPRVSARTRSLPAFLAAAARGSASAAPSPPPRRLVPDQARTASALQVNIRAEYRSQQGLPGLAVTARVGQARGVGERGQRRVVQTRGG